MKRVVIVFLVVMVSLSFFDIETVSASPVGQSVFPMCPGFSSATSESGLDGDLKIYDDGMMLYGAVDTIQRWDLNSGMRAPIGVYPVAMTPHVVRRQKYPANYGDWDYLFVNYTKGLYDEDPDGNTWGTSIPQPIRFPPADPNDDQRLGLATDLEQITDSSFIESYPFAPFDWCTGLDFEKCFGGTNIWYLAGSFDQAWDKKPWIIQSEVLDRVLYSLSIGGSPHIWKVRIPSTREERYSFEGSLDIEDLTLDSDLKLRSDDGYLIITDTGQKSKNSPGYVLRDDRVVTELPYSVDSLHHKGVIITVTADGRVIHTDLRTFARRVGQLGSIQPTHVDEYQNVYYVATMRHGILKFDEGSLIPNGQYCPWVRQHSVFLPSVTR